MTDTYSFFLFSQLYIAIYNASYAYDWMYEDICELYREYVNSSYNDLYKGEYECMEEFLKSKEEGIKERILYLKTK